MVDYFDVLTDARHHLTLNGCRSVISIQDVQYTMGDVCEMTGCRLPLATEMKRFRPDRIVYTVRIVVGGMAGNVRRMDRHVFKLRQIDYVQGTDGYAMIYDSAPSNVPDNPDKVVYTLIWHGVKFHYITISRQLAAERIEQITIEFSCIHRR